MRFSPSSLSVFRNCPRCFWWTQNKGVKPPRGIFPSLPGGIDKVMKAYVEACVHAGTGVPHLLPLPDANPYHDRGKVLKWQNWRTGMMMDLDCGKHGMITISGAIDDLIEWPDGRVSPWDYKTKGSAPKEGDSERYYGPQLDMYHALLESAGLELTGYGYFTYLWPREVVDAESIGFNHQTIMVQTDPKRATQLVIDAMDCITGPEPEDMGLCDYCTFAAGRQVAVQQEFMPVESAPTTKKPKRGKS